MTEKFHLLDVDTATVQLPQQFTCPFCYEPHPLALMAVERVQRYVATRDDWADELGAGKMLGVLVAQDCQGRLGYLAAFSGNLAGSVRHDYFVPPVYDLLDPQGEFKQGSRRSPPLIVRWNVWSILPNCWHCVNARRRQGKKCRMKSTVSRL